jgi:hypothetical protein
LAGSCDAAGTVVSLNQAIRASSGPAGDIRADDLHQCRQAAGNIEAVSHDFETRQPC